MLTPHALTYIEGKDQNQRAHLELYHRNPDILERALNWTVLSICGEVRIHASYKTTKTWENVNNQGTKMILLSVELWSIANNSKNFENKSNNKK